MIKFYVWSNNSMTHVHSDSYECDAPAICQRLESERNDGLSVTGWLGGVLVASREGWVDDSSDDAPEAIIDVATAALNQG